MVRTMVIAENTSLTIHDMGNELQTLLSTTFNYACGIAKAMIACEEGRIICNQKTLMWKRWELDSVVWELK